MPLRNLSLLVNIQWTTGVTRWLHRPNTLNGNIISMIKRAGEITADFRSSKVTSGWLVAIHILLISPLMFPIWSNFSSVVETMNLQWMSSDFDVGIKHYLTQPFDFRTFLSWELYNNYNTSWLFFSLLWELDLSKSWPTHPQCLSCCTPSTMLRVPVSYMFPYKNLSSGGQRESTIAVSSIRDVRKDPRKHCSLWRLGNPLHPSFQTSYTRMCNRAKTVELIYKFWHIISILNSHLAVLYPDLNDDIWILWFSRCCWLH